MENKIIADDKRRKMFLVSVLLTNIMTMLNTTTVTISLPSYMRIFQVDINTVQWVAVGYLLPLGMAMPLSEYLCNRYSYRKVFLYGIAAMGVCSLGCACSTTFYMLVGFRFLKGIAGGLIIPCAMAMLYRYIPKHLQASYLGSTVLFQSVGVALGPTIAGILLQISNWHVLFLINLPLVVLALWIGWKSVPKETGNQTEKFDFISILQVSVGTGLALIAFTEGESWGWDSILFLSCMGTGLVLVVLFILRQLHHEHPLLNFDVLRYRPFVLALLIQCTLSMTLGITVILAQLYFQTVRGYSPAAVGLFLLVPSLTMIVGNNISVRLHKKGLASWLMIVGMGSVALGNICLTRLTLHTGMLFLLLCFSLRYLGMGLAQMPLTNYGLAGVPDYLSGHASSMYNWAKQLAQVVSTNVFTVIMSMNLTRYYLAAGNTGVPTEGTDAYNIAATQAVNSDFLYLSIFLVISFFCTFLTRKNDKAVDQRR